MMNWNWGFANYVLRLVAAVLLVLVASSTSSCQLWLFWA
jgi:hypothetical protein